MNPLSRAAFSFCRSGMLHPTAPRLHPALKRLPIRSIISSTNQVPQGESLMVWKWTKRIGFGVLGITAFLATSGLLYQTIATKVDQVKYPPVGKMVDIGGYRLHIQDSGKGPIPVVFDAGMGCNSLEWEHVQTEASKFTRACSYDRAGNGWSDESPLERTSENIVEELRTLLKNANIPSPYILVGHSFGGPNVLLYANKYPEEVAGIILVDSSHEDQLERMPSVPEGNEGMALLLTYFGGIRLLSHRPQYSEALSTFSEDIQKTYSAKTSTNSFIRTVFKEMSLFKTSLGQLKLAAEGRGIKDKPLIVITAGKPLNAKEAGLSEEDANQIQKVWPELQKDLVSKSRRGKQVIAQNSGHMITREQPEIVSEAIREMLTTLEEKP